MASINSVLGNAQERFKKASAITQTVVLALALLTPLLLSGSASAAQLTSRRVTISDSVASETGVQYDFQFSWSPATDVEGVRFQFCTTPLGTCTKPAGMDINRSLVTLDAHTGFPTNGTAFAEYTGNANGCNDSAGITADTMYCIQRTEAASATGTNATVDLGAVTNPSTTNSSVYIRISLYDNATFTGSPIHDGTVAAAIVERLTITGRVQERLDFCVSAIQDGTALPANVGACPAVGDSAVDLGTIDNTSIATSPVATTATNGSDDDYGILMVNTNASNGVAIVYFVEDATSVSGGDTDQLKAFRVLPANCDASAATLTDQCFQSASNAGSGTNFSAGTEMFGLHIPCIDNTQGTTSNLANVPDPYNNTDGVTTYADNCHSFDGLGGGTPDTGDSFGWNVSGTADLLASSTAVVDDEIVKVRFGATASATTPTGSYTAVTTYIATATF